MHVRITTMQDFREIVKSCLSYCERRERKIQGVRLRTKYSFSYFVFSVEHYYSCFRIQVVITLLFSERQVGNKQLRESHLSLQFPLHARCTIQGIACHSRIPGLVLLFSSRIPAQQQFYSIWRSVEAFCSNSF